MSAPNNDHVKLHPANLAALQKANYLFHCAHNCFLAPELLSWALWVEQHGSYLSLSHVLSVMPRACNWSDPWQQIIVEDPAQVSQVAWLMICAWQVVLWLVSFNLRLDHIAYDHAPLHNPLHLACYVEEDGVGQVKRLASRSHPKRLGEQVLSRYAASVCCRWLRQLTDWTIRYMGPTFKRQIVVSTYLDFIWMGSTQPCQSHRLAVLGKDVGRAEAACSEDG